MAVEDNVSNIQHAGELVVRSRAQTIRTAKAATTIDPYSEIGTSGLRQWGGFVLEEWLQQLTGRRAAWQYREMMDNSPVIGAVLFAIDYLARSVEWRVEEGNDPAAAEFVEGAIHDMEHTWGDFISETLSMLPYGWCFEELVYKKRDGEQPDPPWDPADEFRGFGGQGYSYSYTAEDDSHAASSAYKDGKIGWRKIPVRAQETLLRWHFTGYSGVAAMEQIDWHGGNHVIPVTKALLFRSRPRRNNPEGYSILRSAFTSYQYVKGIQAIEAIGIERDLAGIPMATPPEGVDIFAPSQAGLLAKVQELVTSIRRDEYDGIIKPSSGWGFELLTTGGTRQINTDPVVRRYEQRILASMLADFVVIGQDSVGSFAMVDVKEDLFGVALDGILDLVCEVFNEYAVKRLLKLNGMDTSEPPRVAHGSAGRINLERVGQFLQALAMAQAPIPWSVELLKALFVEAGLPTNFEEHAKPDTLPTVEPKPEPIMPGDGDGEGPAADNGAKPDDDDDQQQPVSKAQEQPSPHGTAIDIGPHLRRRAQVLSAQLEQELNAVLTELGEQAAAAYQATAQKASLSDLHRLVGRVLAHLNLRQWIQTRLMPILRNHAARTSADTERTIEAEIGIEVHIGEQEAQRLALQAGQDLQLPDIEKGVRLAILQAIRDGLTAGENPVATARRIRSMVPAGRFVHAGSRYRAQLIARNETANAQRASTLALYESNPHVVAVKLQDGVYGPPRSDSTCMARNGDEVPISEARSTHPLHPLCTLGFIPVVSAQARPREPLPAPPSAIAA
jgi:hypothetical protein